MNPSHTSVPDNKNRSFMTVYEVVKLFFYVTIVTLEYEYSHMKAVTPGRWNESACLIEFPCQKKEEVRKMKYTVLVSHGKFAQGLADSLAMLAGEKPEVLACGLENGKSADEFAEVFKDVISVIREDDEIILLADLIGGSPLTTAMNVLSEKGMLKNTAVIGGMNLPLALTTVVMKDMFPMADLVSQVLSEAHSGLHEFAVTSQEEDDI